MSTFHVTTADDDAASPPAGSLREALSNVMISAPDASYTIDFDPGLDPIVLAADLPVVGCFSKSDPVITINGNNNTIDGIGAFQAFFITPLNNNGSSAVGGATVTVNDLTFLLCSNLGGDGTDGGGGAMGAGGAVYVDDNVVFTGSNLSFSQCLAGGGAGTKPATTGCCGGGGGYRGGKGGGGVPASGVGNRSGGGGAGFGSNGGSVTTTTTPDAGGGGGGAFFANAIYSASSDGGDYDALSGGEPGGGGGAFKSAGGSAENGGFGGDGGVFTADGGAGSTTVGGTGGFGAGGGGGGTAGGNGGVGGGGGGTFTHAPGNSQKWGGGGGTQFTNAVAGSSTFGGGGGGSAAGTGGNAGFGGGSGGGQNGAGSVSFGGGQGGSGASASGGGGAALGGAIFVSSLGLVTLNNCDAAGGIVEGGGADAGGTPGQPFGTGLFLQDGSTITVDNGATTSITDTISSDGTWIKSGAGVLSLLSPNPDETSTLHLNGGTVEAHAGATMGLMQIVINSSGVMAAMFISAMGSSNIRVNSGGTMSIFATGGMGTSTTLVNNLGTFLIAADVTINDDSIEFSAGAILSAATGVIGTYAGTILIDIDNMNKQGLGTIIFTADNSSTWFEVMTVEQGTVQMDGIGGHLSVADSFISLPVYVTGSGSFNTLSVFNGGIIKPTQTLTVDSFQDVHFNTGSTLSIGVVSPQSAGMLGSTYSRLAINNGVQIFIEAGCTLIVDVTGTFPTSIVVISCDTPSTFLGTFDIVQVPGLPPGYVYVVEYSSTAVTVVFTAPAPPPTPSGGGGNLPVFVKLPAPPPPQVGFDTATMVVVIVLSILLALLGFSFLAFFEWLDNPLAPTIEQFSEQPALRIGDAD